MTAVRHHFGIDTLNALEDSAVQDRIREIAQSSDTDLQAVDDDNPESIIPTAVLAASRIYAHKHFR